MIRFKVYNNVLTMKMVFILLIIYYYDNLPNPVFKSFDDLIIEFDISFTDKRKYDTLFENVINRGILDVFRSGPGFLRFFFSSNNLILTWLLRLLVILITPC